MLRMTCVPRRCVRTAAGPVRATSKPTIVSITMLRRNRISNEPMWRCNSRTATAMAANDSTAPPIHRAPRSVAGFEPMLWLANEKRKAVGHLPAHLPAGILRAHEGDRRAESVARRSVEALDAHSGAVGPRAPHQDDEALARVSA